MASSNHIVQIATVFTLLHQDPAKEFTEVLDQTALIHDNSNLLDPVWEFDL